MKPANGFEVFCDPSYYDLWAARPVSETSFYGTAHFMTEEEACAWTHDPSQKPDPRFN